MSEKPNKAESVEAEPVKAEFVDVESANDFEQKPPVPAAEKLVPEVDETRVPGPSAARILRVLLGEGRELYGAEILKLDPNIKPNTFYSGYDDLAEWGWAEVDTHDEEERPANQRGARRVYLKITQGGIRALVRYDFIHRGILPSR